MERPYVPVTGRRRRKSDIGRPELALARELAGIADSITNEAELKMQQRNAGRKQDDVDLVEAIVPTVRTIKNTLTTAVKVMEQHGGSVIRDERCRQVLLEFFRYSSVVEPVLLASGIVLMMCKANMKIQRNKMRWVRLDIDAYDLKMAGITAAYKTLLVKVQCASELLKNIMEATSAATNSQSNGNYDSAATNPSLINSMPITDANGIDRPQSPMFTVSSEPSSVPSSNVLLQLDELKNLLDEAQDEIQELQLSLDNGKHLLETIQEEMSSHTRKWALGSIGITAAASAAATTLARYDVISMRTAVIFSGFSLIPLGHCLLLIHDDLTDVKLELKKKLLFAAVWREKLSSLNLKVRKMKQRLRAVEYNLPSSHSVPQFPHSPHHPAHLSVFNFQD